MSELDPRFTRAYSDYENAKSVAKRCYPKAADDLIHLVAATVLNHVRQSPPLEAAPKAEAKVIPITAVSSPCPKCGQAGVPNPGKAKNPKAPDYKCTTCKKPWEKDGKTIQVPVTWWKPKPETVAVVQKAVNDLDSYAENPVPDEPDDLPF